MTENVVDTFLQTDEFEEIKNAVKRFIKYRFDQDSDFQEKAKDKKKTILLGGWIDDGAIEKAFEKCTQVAKDEKAVIFVTTERYETEDGLWEGEKYKIKNLNLSRILAEFLNAPIISLQDTNWSEKLGYYLTSDISSERSKIGSLIEVLEKVGNSYPGGKRDSTRLLTDTLKDLATDKRAQREHDLQNEASTQVDPNRLLDIRKKQFFDAIVDCVDAMRHPKLLACLIGNKNSEDNGKAKDFNIVIFDNNLDENVSNFLILLTKLFPKMKFYWTKRMDFRQLIDNLRQSALEESKNKLICVKGVNCENSFLQNIDGSDSKICEWNEVDLILQDLYLNPGQRQPTGHEMVSDFAKYVPEIPVFVFSSSPSIEDVNEAKTRGADNYVWKGQTLALTKRILEFFEDTGSLITYISDPDIRRNLVGNIRHWKQRPEYLWFGDKCYHMINHNFNHVKNDWRIARQILTPILEHLPKNYLSDEDIYCFLMAIWLHDIGHKGNERYGEPHEIRDLHGLISAELILKFPEHYGIYDYNKPDSSPYRWLSFRHPRTAPQIIRERIASLEAVGRVLKQADKKVNVEQHIQKLTILEKIALLCIYHKSNFPMDEKDLKNIVRKGKRIPRDCYENFDRSTSPIHLKSFSDLMGDQNLLQLMALFRFIDGLDINENRVGDETEEGVKKETIKRDLRYQLFKLKNDVSQLAKNHLRNTEKERRFISLFYDQVEQNIQEQQWISEDLKKEQRRFLDTLQVDVPLDNYYMLTEYIEFISVQEGHFDLHNSIHKLEIKDVLQGNGKLRFRIKYISRKKADILNNKDKVTVKERGQKEGRTIRDHLMGEPEEKDSKKTGFRKNDGYVRRELNNGKRYLKEWFDLDGTKIYLHDSGGVKYEELLPKEQAKEI